LEVNVKKFLLVSTLVGALLAPSSLLASDTKGLNVLITSADAQTQMMGMVLSTSTIKDHGKAVNITLCGAAGNLALKDFKAGEVKRPDGKVVNPKAALGGLIKAGASVQVCPLFLPTAGLEASALSEGISIAKPPIVAKGLLDEDYKNISF
jgi:predicted peroxiredoxin